MIDADLPAWLANLGTLASSNVFSGNPPQNPPFPFILVWRLSGTEERDLSTGRAIVQRSTFRIEFFGRDYTEAHAVADAVHAALDGFRGQMLGTNVGYSLRQNFGPDLSEVSGDQTIRRLPSEYAFITLEA